MSPFQHVIEYAKSGRAKCRGNCIDRCIPQGSLRYGSLYHHQIYGETTAWFHWECSSKALPKLAKVKLEQVPGFRELRLEDQERVRADVQARTILAVPSSSQTISEPLSSSQPASSQHHPNHEVGDLRGQKRKRTQENGSQQNRDSHTAATNDDDEYFDPSQDEAKDELYVSLPSKIVGVQYYRGLVGAGEEVTLVREYDNQYDKNAIQVLNISREKVGHIPRNVAEKLAPLIDENRVTVEGVIHGGPDQYTIPITLRIYGASNRRPELELMLIWATPRQKGFTDAMRPNGYPSGSQISSTQASAGPSNIPEAQRQRLIEYEKAAELKSLLNSLEKVDDEGRRSSLLDIVCPNEDLLNLPTHPDPPSVANGQLKADLLRHQSQALQWCIERENPVLPQKESDKPVQFWQYKIGHDKKPFYLNLVTHSPQTNPPALGRGGLMADAMGLGKTLTMLALIAATKSDVSENFSNSTLIVVPVSVISNWKTQINDHITEGFLTYHVYHEGGRSITPKKLAKFDVVITAYPTVTGDFAPKDSNEEGASSKKKKLDQGLFGVKWKRIILDEGHTIRNHKTKMSVAVKNLEAERRWVVSGTPIINSPKDLGSLLEFLRICRPLDNDEYYKRLIMRPITQGAPEGAELLKALMSHICIRRTKEMQNEKGEYLVPLPPVEMTLVPVKLDEATRKLYDEIEALSQQRFTSMMNLRPQSTGKLSMPTNVLSLLTRLRQLTLHPGLIPRDYLEQLRSMVISNDAQAVPPPAIPVTPEERIRLQNILARAIEDSEECPVCFEITNEPRITPCAHIFCLACITEVITRDPRCPMDRRTIHLSDLISPLPPTDATQAPPPKEDEDEDAPASSAKVEQLIHLLQLTPRNEKSLVFSQFTSFLDKIAEALDEAGISYVRFDGQMSAGRRQQVLERFNQPLEEVQDMKPSQSAFPVTQSTRSTRSKRNMNGFVSEAIEAGDEEDDFVPDDDDDDPFEDMSEDDWSKKSKGKGKAKAKGKGKGKQKANGKSKLKDDFDCSDGINPAVMLISLKAGALGLNLTVANNVYLMDPWWQEGIESQAIDRCNRIGQTKPVHVYQLVAENTVEAKVLEIQERKKTLIREAFSGLKNTETQRLKKEARLQDLIELFGARRDANPQTST